ncbi:sodium-independent sulfate anion transporter isoform X2 [Stomoxys calcitrans]|uniref:sodium-independent sulfate anion transporter isoform X2 n=1 Tax=Stomoxys calcitrans TaxID=35570 RepID=UPI0027E2AD74|nr:sodium-independent sulfate anion transporter isoform X2 [Stomoxys calcitrans]
MPNCLQNGITVAEDENSFTYLVSHNLYHENLPNICQIVKNRSKKCCEPATCKQFLPIISWLPKYNVQFLLADFVAGLTVGLTAIPQAIAYASIAGLPTQFGLYSAFMGCFVYIVFGTCKDITVGPTAIMALMVQAHVTGSSDYAVLTCFLSGCVIFLLGIFNLGVLVRFISIPVTTGFTTAAAITIASGQVNNLFGIKSSSNEFIESWVNFFGHITETRRNDAILGIATLVLLLLMMKIKDLPLSCKMLTKYISLSRNALAVIVGIVLCYCLSHDGWLPFRASGEITKGIPPFKPPPFSTTVNGTKVTFGEMVTDLGASLASIPLISILESIAIAKAFSKGKIVDASQEMVALGLCNILSSFFSSMPITGSFTRTSINHSSGVKTPLGGAVTGALVLMALAFLTTTFSYIPKATLAAIIISAMIFMVEYERIIEIWRSKKMDVIPFSVTALVCLFWSLEYGMVCGIFVNAIFILYKSARPKILISLEKVNSVPLGLVQVQENLCYSSAEYLKSKVVKFVTTQGDNSIKMIIIKGDEITNIDSTVGLNILSLKEDLSLLECSLICWNWNYDAAGVICRLHPKERSMFKFGKSISEIVAEVAYNMTQTEIVDVPEDS